MYKSPDFVKVDLEIKDNFAAYSSCYRNSYVLLTNNETVVPTGVCSVTQVTTLASTETDYECFVNDMGY